MQPPDISQPSLTPIATRPSPPSCALCGLPLGRSQLKMQAAGEMHRFCCPGCLHVFEILLASSGGTISNFRDTEIFRTCVAAGLIPGAGRADEKPLAPDGPLGNQEINDPGLELTLKIEGMWCTGCAWLINEVLTRTPGVIAAEVLFFADLARLRYLPPRISPKEIIELIRRFGYDAHPVEQESDKGRFASLLGPGIAAILTSNVMMISLALYGGFFQELEPGGIRALSLPLCLLATPVVFWSGWPILQRGWQGLRLGRPSMDTLIGLAALAAYSYSLWQMGRGSLHLYFDTAAMLVTLVLIGRLVEGRIRRRLNLKLTELQELALGGKIRKLVAGGRERWVRAAELKIGELFAVRAGEKLAVDGRVVEGRAEVNEAAITGESRPRTKATEDEVLAGSQLCEGGLTVMATRIGPASSLGQMLSLMQQALAAKNPIEQFTDRITRWFVPLIISLAAATGLVLQLQGQPLEEAVLRALTVLVIACPCALGIAAPLAKVAITAAARSQGIVVRDAAAFEQARQLDTIVFDKTGTLTEGCFALHDLHAPGLEPAAVLRRVAAVEAGANHFLAREIRRKAAELGIVPARVQNQQIIAGLGVSGAVDSEEVAVGSRRFMQEQDLAMPKQINDWARAAEGSGESVIFAAWQGQVRAAFRFGDSIKRDAAEVTASLARRGLDLWLVSGDSQATTAAVAGQLGIPNFMGQASPEDKVSLIRRLQDQGKQVAMIGDGINDAAALAAADTGIAIGSSPARLMEEAADVTLLGGSAGRLLAMLSLSAALAVAIRQNLAFAFFYNTIGIILAMLGLLNPLLAVLAMFASSLTVIANTMRVVAGAKVRKQSEEYTTREGEAYDSDVTDSQRLINRAY